MNDHDAIDVHRLAVLLGEQQLTAYTGDLTNAADALPMYQWNIDAGAAVLAMSAMVEVLVRNAMDRALTAWAVGEGWTDWFAFAPLENVDRRKMEEARRNLAKTDPSSPSAGLLAHLSFGFWRALAGPNYVGSLWVPALKYSFPHGPTHVMNRQRRVKFILDNLVFLRNRAAHHEPIHRRDLIRDNDLAVELAAMIDPVAGEWVARRSTIPAVVAAKPTFGA